MTGRYRWWIGDAALPLHRHQLPRPPDPERPRPAASRPSSSGRTRTSPGSSSRSASSYTVMQAVSGRLLDRFGTRNGLTLAVLWYSTVAMLTALATGFASFCGLRFLLGAGEAANWPAATKAVSRVVPAPRARLGGRALRQRLLGGRGAGHRCSCSFLSPYFGGWRPAFLITGALGLRVARRSGGATTTRRRRTRGVARSGAARRSSPTAQQERAGAAPPPTQEPPPRAHRCCGCAQTWGAIASRGAHRSRLVHDHRLVRDLPREPRASTSRRRRSASGCRSWPPTSATSSAAASRAGSSGEAGRVGRARRTLDRGRRLRRAGARSRPRSCPSFSPLVACFAVATFSYAVMSTMALSLPADLFESRAVASVAGLSGAAAGAGTIDLDLPDRRRGRPLLVHSRS